MDAILDRREHSSSTWDLFFSSPSFFLAQKIYAFFRRQTQESATQVSEPANSHHQIRVVCISDTHNQHESTTPLPDGDILIHAGDLTQSGTSEELERALTWMSAQPHAHKLFIAGNHDAALADPAIVAHLCTAHPSLTYLKDSKAMVTVGGRALNVYGSPHTPQHGSWPFQYPRVYPSQAASSTQWATIPLWTDLLITHGPPAYHLDNGGAGCAALLQALWRVRPRLHVFGHIHAARGVEDVSWTAEQKAYERVCEKRGGWWDLLVLLAVGVRGGKGEGARTTLVNASVVGGYRDELRRSAIVVDI